MNMAIADLRRNSNLITRLLVNSCEATQCGSGLYCRSRQRLRRLAARARRLPCGLRSPPGMTEAEFERLVASGMQSAVSVRLMKAPLTGPFPKRRIVRPMNLMAARGVMLLVVNVSMARVPSHTSNRWWTTVLQLLCSFRGDCIAMTSRLSVALGRRESDTPA
jgi:hypothetical protein